MFNAPTARVRVSDSFYVRAVILSILVFLLNITCEARGEEPDPSLKFQISGQTIGEITLSEMKSKLTTRRIELYDIEYEKTKRYEGFALKDVLKLGFGDKLKTPAYTDIAFIALDGYNSVAVLSKVLEKGGYIVFSDLGSGKWEPIGRQGADPGPFYLVWTGKGQTPENEYPWPWQIASINIMRFEDQYPLVFPNGAAEGSAVFKGYEIFKGRCVRCHSMNRQGGKIGPDLNAPRSIVAYRSDYMIKEFIKHPSQYRYTHMPDHPDLTDQDLDDLVAYFHYMNKLGK